MTDQSVVPAKTLDDMTRLSITEALRRAGEALDRLWLTAAMEGSVEALRLAEASQDVHRALIVLTPP